MFVAALVVGYLVVLRRLGISATRRQRTAWITGVALLWVASDWPVGTLGSGYLASAHMLQYFLYTFAAAPLLVLGIPGAVAERLLGSVGRRAYAIVAKPVVAGLGANAVLLATHAPVTVDTFRSSQLGSFALDLVWLVGGLVMWLPVCGPIARLRPTYPVRCVYLFLAAGLVPMVPGGFLTFADFPLYTTYELAPRVGSIDPVDDQQLAGALMKIGNLPLIWPIIGVMFWRWAQKDQATTLRTTEPATNQTVGSP
jgi:putative membrane protein